MLKEQVKEILIRRDGFEGLPNDQWYDEFAQEICDLFLQARQKIFEEIEKHGFYAYNIFPSDWQALKEG